MHEDAKVESVVGAALIFALINTCPLVLAKILYKKNDELEDKRTVI